MQENAILTLALNYSFSDLRVFLESLSRTSFKGVVYLIVNNKIAIPSKFENFTIEQIIAENLKFDSNTYKVGIAEFIQRRKRKKITENFLNLFLENDFTNPEQLDFFSSFYHCQISRYAIYLKILLSKEFKNVFLTDSRDVYFQSNPFNINESGFHIFQENINYVIKDRPFNNQWVKLSTNFWNYLKVRNKPIYCSGTILGDYYSVIDFLKLFLNKALENNLPFDIKGLDQGLFNVLIHTNKLKKINAHSDQNHVLTLSAMDVSEYKVTNNLICNAEGNPSAVVHQYDRHQNLVEFINNKLNIN